MHNGLTPKRATYMPMPKRIPDGIRPEHIIAAVHDLDAGVHHGFGESTVYDLLYDGRRYPPKAVVGLASGKILGTPLGPYDFKGGLESKCFEVLEKNEFTIVPKDGLDSGHSDVGRKSNPDWTRDELIIALNAYLHVGSPFPAKDGREILELSDVLNRLGEKLFPPEQRSETFRNQAGVYMKLMNFRRFDPAYTSQGKVGLTRGSAGEQEVWNEFHSDPTRCEKVATATLFDRGYLTISPDYHVEVSRRLKDEFDNGKEYYALQGKTILLPGNPAYRPSPEQLMWHNEHVYRPA
jgi:hypothetical protein